MNKLNRQVSHHKFTRVLKNFDSAACRAYRYRNKTMAPEASVDAYVLGDYCYAVFLISRGKDRLERVYTRYWVGEGHRVDSFAYVLGYNDRF
jgi:hypothetical protein